MGIKEELNKKQLTCQICGILTSVDKLKAFPDGKWVCSECSYRHYPKTHFSKLRKPVRKEEKEEPVIHFDPFKDEEIFAPKVEVIKKEKPKTFFSNVKMPRTKDEKPKLTLVSSTKKEVFQKIVYKCAFCKFESRHSKIGEVCPNCGRKEGLKRVMSSAELLKEVDKEPYFN